MKFRGGQPDRDVVGMYASRKWDGFRVVWTKGQLWTRGGIHIQAPEYFLCALPPDTDLDGELVIAETDRAKLQGLLRNKNHPRWREARYMVFDIVDHGQPLTDRVRRLGTLGLRHPAVPVKHVRLRSVQQLRRMYRGIKARGGEGVVLRAADQNYRGGRTNGFLKVKRVPAWD